MVSKPRLVRLAVGVVVIEHIIRSDKFYSLVALLGLDFSTIALTLVLPRVIIMYCSA